MTVWIDYAARIKESIDPLRSALFVVDVQHSFCSPTGRTARKHSNVSMQQLPPRINRFVDYFSDLGGLTLYLKSVPDDTDTLESEKWLNRLKGISRPSSTDEIELDLFGLNIKENSIVMEKTGDGFSRSELKSILDKNDIRNVLVCGVRTEICVRRVAERTATEGYLVFVLRDLCATRDNCKDHEDQAFLFLNAYTGVVLDTARMSELLSVGTDSANTFNR